MPAMTYIHRQVEMAGKMHALSEAGRTGRSLFEVLEKLQLLPLLHPLPPSFMPTTEL